MEVVDYEPYAWFLFEQEGQHFVDVNCNHSAVGYGILVQLNEEEEGLYRDFGRPYIDKLAQSIQDAGPGSTLQLRDVTPDYREETKRAIEAWRVKQRS